MLRLASATASGETSRRPADLHRTQVDNRLANKQAAVVGRERIFRTFAVIKNQETMDVYSLCTEYVEEQGHHVKY